MAERWPVRVETGGTTPLTAATVLYRPRGGEALVVTIVVKATFQLAAEGVVAACAADPIVAADVPADPFRASSIAAASDLAPVLPCAQVILTGNAYAPPGRKLPQLSTRLRLGRLGHLLLEKRVDVLGERIATLAGAATPPLEWQSMPLRYERAVFHPVHNPVGVQPRSGVAPNLVNPADAALPAGYGPLAEAWPCRQRLGAPVLVEHAYDIPADFDWSFFLAAPPDQRLAELHGDEELELFGLHPTAPVIGATLPGAQASAQIAGLGSALEAVSMRADTLLIDTAEQRCSLVWRGSFATSQALLSELTVKAAVHLTRFAMPSMPPGPAGTPRTPGKPARPLPNVGLTGTVVLSDDDLVSAVSSVADVAVPAAVELVDGSHTAQIARPAEPALPFAPPPPQAAAAPPMRPPAAKENLFGTAPLGLEQPRHAAVLPFAPPNLGPGPAITSSEVAESPFTGTVSLSHEQALAAQAAASLPFIQKSPRSVRHAPRGDAPSAPVRPAKIVTERTTPAIPVYGVRELALVCLPWELKAKRSSLSVMVKGTFAIQPDAPATLLEAAPPTGDVHLDDDPDGGVIYPSDLALYKPRADVTLQGHAVGGSKGVVHVQFQVGRGKNTFHRKLAAIGERRWTTGIGGATASKPAPFERLALRWERAFGGSGFDQNPVGTGFDGSAPPNLEDPDRLVGNPSDRPTPVCFAPVSPFWKQRWSKLGSYGKDWVDKRWPYFPADFNWSFFQAAPPSQQLAYLAGDEPFTLAGMHAEHGTLRGSLPGLAARCFIHLTPEAGGVLSELLLSLDTLHFDVDAMQLHLVWRGVIEVEAEDAPEIGAFFLALDSLARAPMSLDDARAALAAELATLEPVADSPDGEPAVANLARQTLRESDERRGRIAAAMAAAGIAELPAFEQGESRLRAARVAPELVAEVLHEEEQSVRSARLRKLVLARLDANEDLAGIELDGVDLSHLDFTGRHLAGANLKGARLAHAVLTRADLTRAVLSLADLEGANLDDAILEDADLTGTRLDGASAERARVSRADFGEALARGASLKGITGVAPSFARADVSEARFDGAALVKADFAGAALGRTVFKEASVADILLYDAQGDGTSFTGATLTNARADGAHLPNGRFRGALAAGSIWDGAVLDRADFARADLSRGSLERASCLGATFSAAKLVESCLRKTKLQGAKLAQTNLHKATLESADLRGADLRGANLHGAEVWKADLEGAMLDKAIVSKTKLAGKQARAR